MPGMPSMPVMAADRAMGRDDRKALAKVIVITKDEHDLIADFLEFYGALFGRENVVVVDNGSDPADERVQGAYRAHLAAGGDVRVDARPFVDAVAFMSEHMRSIAPTCEFILPLETDEFIYMIDRASDEGYATARADVEAALAGARDILAERISDDARARTALQRHLQR